MKISIDSRTIKPGDTFIPVKGPNFDGHDFIEDVISKGGKVLDVDLFEYAKKYRKKLDCTVIGITGSAGKTTVKDMLAAILGQDYRVVKTHENQNNEFGVPLTILSADATTQFLIVEMGMRKKGDISFLTKILQPDVVVMTNIGLSHIEFFQNQRQLCLAKAEIFRKALRWQQKKRVSFINFNTPYHEVLVKKAKTQDYTVFPFKGDDKLSENMNACYTIASHFGVSESVIKKGLAEFKTSSKRLKVIEASLLTIIDDSYNSNPDGVDFALRYLSQYKNRKIAVLADMLELGKHSQEAHQNVMEWVLNYQIDVLFTYGEAFESVADLNKIGIHFKSKKELHSMLKHECKRGDVILVKGSRSMKMEETVDFIQSNFT